MKRFQAPFALDPDFSRGRLFKEEESPPRTAFERDRDRIIHAAAFRRLKHKTQVFIAHEGDHYRTRLTHSLEVAQVARAISRALGLDEDITEALALAHDLGHTPFGHAGERELNQLMAPYGGFDHNAQSLRIVTELERRYARFDGLNLTWETLEGLVKHNGPLIDAEGNAVGAYAQTGLPQGIIAFNEVNDLALAQYASAEAQVAAIADDIAYNAHDIDDGLRAKLFDIIDLGDIPFVGQMLANVLKSYPGVERPRIIHETVRRVLSAMIQDVIEETKNRAKKSGITSVQQVRLQPDVLVTFSPQMKEYNRVLQSFLRKHMYRHDRIMEMMERAQRILRDLFEIYMNKPQAFPQEWLGDSFDDAPYKARLVADFLSGMTDRYALEQHKRLFDLDPLFR